MLGLENIVPLNVMFDLVRSYLPVSLKPFLLTFLQWSHPSPLGLTYLTLPHFSLSYPSSMTLSVHWCSNMSLPLLRYNVFEIFSFYIH